ncbi:unnamed protein product [Mytilus coruscus]|uniref:Uncharacterized protein n=1 Tax=Mytilus coruscus TaxID=42192 RepID=A0A6J8CKZ6_MYTCO|nr:unnamed protein product [Mytilus coruscus]
MYITYEKLSRSKRSAITADRKLNIDQVLLVHKNAGYVLPVGTRMTIPMSKVTNLHQTFTMNPKIATTSENIAFRERKIQPIKHQEIIHQESNELNISGDDNAAISEIFETLKLSKGQSMDDFYAQLLEKATILYKSDHAVLIKFIKGFSDQLAFFVRAGYHSDSANCLTAAKMGEAYGYRKDDAPLVAAATKSADNTPVAVKALNNFKTDVVSELHGQINSLSQSMSKLATGFSQQLDCTRNVKGNDHFPCPRNRCRQVSQSDRGLCRKCQAPGHFARPSNWNERGNIDSYFTCHICGQTDRKSPQCVNYSGNRSNPGFTGQDPRGGNLIKFLYTTLNISNKTVLDSDHEHYNNYSDSTECTSDDDSAFVCKFLYMSVRIANLEISVLIDTGSSKNVMTSQLFNSIPDSKKSEFSATNDKITLTNNQTVQIYGTAKPDFKPKHQRSYRLTPEKKDILRHHLDEHLRQGVFAPVDETEDVPITSLVVLMSKRTNQKGKANTSPKETSLSKFRFCCDFRYLISQTQHYSYSIPDLQDLTESFSNKTPVTDFKRKSTLHRL